MKKIGVSFTGMDENKPEEKQHNYLRWLESAGSGFEIVTLYPSQGLPDLTSFAGIVFSGGVDVRPDYYHGAAEYANAPESFNPVRDAFEKELYKQTQLLAMPVLGICRGMQLINVLNGGTLKQDLGEAGNETHRAIPGDKKHTAVVETGTVLMEVLGSTEIQVNSAHHQAIEKLAPGFRIGAYSADGLPEAMEPLTPDAASFLLAVQWHPERMFHFGLEETSASAGLLRHFINASKKYSENN